MNTPQSYNQPPVPPPYYEEDEITLKELILKLQEFCWEIWRNKWIIIGLAPLLAGIFFMNTRSQQTTYTSSLTFLVSSNNKKVNSGGELGALLGYVTFNYELDKIVQLARSRRVLNKVLFQKVVLDDKTDFLANHLINIYGYHQAWQNEAANDLFEELQLKDFYFTHKNVTDFVPKEYRALNIVHELIAGNSFRNTKGLMTTTYDQKTEMVRLSVTPKNKDLSIQLIEAIFKELHEFYIEESVGRPRRALKVLEAKVDSTLFKLNSQEKELAIATDRHANTISQASNLNLAQLSRKIETTNRIYQEVLKNKEQVEFMLSSETPEFQIIDRTFLPIITAPDRMKTLLIGGFLGGFLGIGFIIARKFIRDAIK